MPSPLFSIWGEITFLRHQLKIYSYSLLMLREATSIVK